jgi:hypothetical protein
LREGTFHQMTWDISHAWSVHSVQWKNIPLRSLKDTLLSVQMFCDWCTSFSCFYTPYITRTVLSPSHSVFVRVTTTWCTCIMSLDFVTGGQRPNGCTKGFIHRWILLHLDWDHQCSHWTCVVKWESLWFSFSPSAVTVLHQPVGWSFSWLPHKPSHFNGTS